MQKAQDTKVCGQLLSKEKYQIVAAEGLLTGWLPKLRKAITKDIPAEYVGDITVHFRPIVGEDQRARRSIIYVLEVMHYLGSHAVIKSCVPRLLVPEQRLTPAQANEAKHIKKLPPLMDLAVNGDQLLQSLEQQIRPTGPYRQLNYREKFIHYRQSF